MVEVILTQDVENLGKMADVVEVSGGYARNFLIPQGRAQLITSSSLKQIELLKKAYQKKVEGERQEAGKLADKISKLSCTMPVKTSEESKIHGSVTRDNIKTYLEGEGIIIDRKQVQLEDPIKKLGIYDVPINLEEGISTTLKVWVVKQ